MKLDPRFRPKQNLNKNKILLFAHISERDIQDIKTAPNKVLFLFYLWHMSNIGEKGRGFEQPGGASSCGCCSFQNHKQDMMGLHSVRPVLLSDIFSVVFRKDKQNKYIKTKH